MNPGRSLEPSGWDPLDIAVVIPCYNVSKTIASVLSRIGPEVGRIYCVDDASADGTAETILGIKQSDYRVRLVQRERNGGVGAAMVDGYRAAIADGAKVLVKIDGDGQMAPEFIANFAAPLLRGESDYVKGNRFFDMETVRAMPSLRIFGNAGLSFLNKLSTGYWDLFDPTNGYTALHADIAAMLPLDQLHDRYFFESDLLFRLSTIRARVIELPLVSQYADETSHLSELRCFLTFPPLHLRNFLKRISYTYFLRNFSIASINLVMGLLLLGFGLIFGIDHWVDAILTGVAATAGTVMLSALPVMLGIQLLLNFLAYDISFTPREVVHRRLAQLRVLAVRQAAE